MRKYLFILSMIICLTEQPVQEPLNQELEILAEIGEDQGWELDEWQVVFINEISTRSFDKIINNLKNSHLITTQKDKYTVKYMIENQNDDEQISHFFQAIVPSNANKITLQTVISGQGWNDSIKENYLHLTKSLLHDNNISITKNFTCLKFNYSDIMNVGFSFDEFWKKMKVIHKKEQNDNVQHSAYKKEFYGFSRLLGDEFEINNEKINFQMTLKNDERNKKQVIIGTPMILNEY